ncbi:bifunctional DNA primase/polymerase [Chloroflexota bacterium]
MRSTPVSINLQASDKPIYDIVCQLHSDGRHVIPTGGGPTGKSPVIPRWVEYQERKPTGSELHEWQQRYHPSVWAVVCGAQSDVIVIDADNQTQLKELEDHGIKPHVLTPKGGHFYVQHPGYPVKPLVNVTP